MTTIDAWAGRLNDAFWARLYEPGYWRPRRRAIRVGKTWHVWLAVPRLTPDGEDLAPDLVVRGTGRTVRAAAADMHRRLNRHGRLYRRALTIDMKARAGSAFNAFIRAKMREEGFARRIMPPIEVDELSREVKEVFAGWGPDGKATFKAVVVDRHGKVVTAPRRVRATDAELDAAIAADPPVKLVKNPATGEWVPGPMAGHTRVSDTGGMLL